jgi:transcriptional regulator with XRE-family HTH domain
LFFIKRNEQNNIQKGIKTMEKRLKEMRKKLGFKSREKFAEALEMPFSTLRSYEQGKVENISYFFLKKINEQYNVSLDWLVSGKGEMLLNEQKSESVNKNFSGNQIVTGDNSNIHGDNHVNINNGTVIKEEPKAVQKSADIEEMCAMMVQYAPREYVQQVRGKLEAFRDLVLD